VTGVAVELGPLAVVQRVLDGQRMQAELLAQHGEVVAVGAVQVQPDGDGLIGQVLADVGDRESLELEPAVPVQPRARLAPGRAFPAEGGRRHLLRILAVEGLARQRPGSQRAAARVAWVALSGLSLRR